MGVAGMENLGFAVRSRFNSVAAQICVPSLRRFARRWQLVVGLAILLSLSGCSRGKTPGSGGTGTATTSKPRPAPTGAAAAPISEQQAKEFSVQLDQQIATGKLDEAERSMDWSSLVDDATAEPDSPDIEPARRGFKAGFLKDANLFRAIGAQTAQGGRYKFLRADARTQPATALFRLKQSSGGLNYHRLILGRSADGKIVVKDIFVMMTGENLSQTVKQAWLPMAMDAGKSKLEKAFSKTDSAVLHLNDILELTKLVNTKKFEDALRVYKRLPADLRRQKSILVMRLVAAQNSSQEEYLQTIDDWRKEYPQDPTLDLILVDSYLLRKEIDQALKCIERIDKAIGGDPFLLCLRATILMQAGRLPEAHTAVEAAVKADPDELDPNSVALDLSLAEKKYDDTARLLTLLTKKFGIQWKDLTSVAQFADFVKSPAYQTWKKSQPAS